MSAVPKKKLCWNCDGNVAKTIDNCPYCGVYLHSTEEVEEETSWGLSSRSSKTEEIPSPLYQIQEEPPQTEQPASETPHFQFSLGSWKHLKQNVLPLLLLMGGSVFFLFGVILLLFAQGATLTLQWQGDHWIYFLALSAPFIFFGWKYLQQLEE